MGNSSKRRNFQYESRAQFVDLSLSRTQESELKKSGFAHKQWTETLNAITSAGYKVTVKVDSRNASVMAMVQSAEWEPDTDTVIYVMRSASAQGALLKLAYYWIIADGTLPDMDAPKQNEEADADFFQ